MPQPFLIAPYATGQDNGLEPWLTPEDAFVEILDGYVYRGVLQPRDGLQQFATGGVGSASRAQSRVMKAVSNEDIADTQSVSGTLSNVPVNPGSVSFSDGSTQTGTDDGQGNINETVSGEAIGNGSPQSYTAAVIPITAGSVTFTDGGAQTAADDGAGNITGDATGTINYTTGALTITWTGAVGGTASMSYSAANSIGTVNYTTGAYSITWGTTVGGDAVVSYEAADEQCVMGIHSYWKNDATRDLIVLSQDNANKYNTTTNRLDHLPFSSNLVTKASSSIFTGSDSQYFHAANYFAKDGTPRLVMVNNANPPVFYDGGTELKGYTTADNGDFVDPSLGTLDKAQWVFSIQDRLIFVAPTLGGTLYPRRYIFSRIQNDSGDGDDFAGEGAGNEILPTNSIIRACVQLKDTLIMFTNDEIWSVTFVDNIDIPVQVRRLDSGLLAGAEAPFSGVQFMGKALGVGGLGIVGTDGRDAFRVDNKIPYFARRDIKRSGIATTFGNVVREHSQFWWNYQDDNDEPTHNTRTLVNNIEENTWASYRHPLSAIGDFELSAGYTWGNIDGDVKAHWITWKRTDEAWRELDNDKLPKTLVGDCDGFVYLAATGDSDQAFEITGATQADPCVLTTEPHNIAVGDEIYIQGVAGMTELNDAIYEVSAVTATTITIGIDASGFTAYSSGGSLEKVYEFEATTKPLNPFAKQNKKARLVKIGFLVDTDTRNFDVALYADRRRDPYQTSRIVTTSDGNANQTKRWVYLWVSQTANFHTMKISQKSINKGRIHAFMYMMDPVGRLEY
jgi:hypothetical protein